MARPPRQLLDHGCYHLIARGNNRQSLFTEPEAFQYFLTVLFGTAPESGEVTRDGFGGACEEGEGACLL